MNEMDQFSYVEIMDIPFINMTKDDFLHQVITPLLSEGEKAYIVTANPEIVMKTQEDSTYKQAVLQADYVVPDGAGIILASKYKKTPLKERIAGFDLLISLLEHANEKGYSCYLLGAEKRVNEKAVKHIKTNYPNVKIAGNHHGFFSTSETIIEEIKESKASIVFVALGMPRQEKWIVEHYDKFDTGFFMGVGGSFDVLAGEVKRAPQAWINLNLEWFYRLLQQPFRFKRTLKVFQFLFKVIFKRE